MSKYSCGIPVSKYDHEIRICDSLVCRDGIPVRITRYTKSGDLKVGCTFITRQALLKLLDLSTDCDVTDEKIVQDGHR
jgi:hypothetical protein